MLRFVLLGLVLLMGCGTEPGAPRPEYFGVDTRPLAMEVDGTVDFSVLNSRARREPVRSFDNTLIDVLNESVFWVYGEQGKPSILVDYLSQEELFEEFGPYVGFADLAYEHLYVADHLDFPASFSVLAHEYGHLRGPTKKEYIAKTVELRLDIAARNFGMDKAPLFTAISKLGKQFFGLADAGTRYERASSGIVKRLARGLDLAALEHALHAEGVEGLNRDADAVFRLPLEEKRRLLRAAFDNLFSRYFGAEDLRAQILAEQFYQRAASTVDG